MYTLEQLFEPYVRGLHAYAQRTCPVTGGNLDVHTAVVVEHSGQVLLAVSQEGWDQRGQDILTHMPDDATVTFPHPHQLRR